MSNPLLNAAVLLEHHVTPTFYLDPAGRVLIWNKACEMLTGLHAASVLGTTNHWKAFYTAPRPCLADLVLTDRIELATELYSAFSQCTTSETAISAEIWCDLPLIGKRAYLTVVATPIFDDQWQMIGAMQTVTDNTRVMDIEARLRDLAGLDGLTGLANRRTFDTELASEWRRSVRSRMPLSLLIVDIDHFKQYNDNFGHQGGDHCLTAVAQILAESLRRAGDFPARYGGEEFVVILPDTDAAGAALVAENIRANVERRALRHPMSGAGPHVTVSVGRATVLPTADDKIEKLVCLADVGLYQAKNLGRNRVCASDTGRFGVLGHSIDPSSGEEFAI